MSVLDQVFKISRKEFWSWLQNERMENRRFEEEYEEEYVIQELQF